MNIEDFDGYTGFMHACALGNQNVVRFLVDAHVKRAICLDVEKVNNDGKSAFQIVQEKNNTMLLSIIQVLDKHRSYTKPLDCDIVQERPKKSARERKKTHDNNKKKRMNLSAIRRALKEAYMSDEEDVDINSENKKASTSEMADLMKVVREAATDIRQIYKEQEINDKEAQKEAKKIHEEIQTSKRERKTGKTKKASRRDMIDLRVPNPQVKNNSPFVHPPPNPRFVHPRQMALPRPPQTVRDDSFIHPPPSGVFIHPPPKGVSIDGIRLQTNDGGRRIVLSDTSNYDKTLASKPKPAAKHNSVFKGPSGIKANSLPLSINGRQNRLAVRLPNRKIWSSLDQSNVELGHSSRPSNDEDLQLPPLKECFNPRAASDNPVKNIDRGMWKIIESYKT